MSALAAEGTGGGDGSVPIPKGVSLTSTATKLCPVVQPHECRGVGRSEIDERQLVAKGEAVCAVVTEKVDLRELNDSHEIGRDVIDTEVVAEAPDEGKSGWEDGAEKPSRDSDAEAQASHSGTVSGTRDVHASTRPLRCHRSPTSQRTASSNVPSNSDSRRVFPDTDSPWAIGKRTLPMLARTSSKETLRGLVASGSVNGVSPKRVFMLPCRCRIGAEFVEEHAEGTGNV